MRAGSGEPRSVRKVLIDLFRLRPRLLTAITFGIAGLVAALIAWGLTGRDTHYIVIRAIVASAVAGMLVGLLFVRWLLRARRFVAVGLLAGLALHPLAWMTFVVWAWCAPWFEGGVPAGTLLGGLGNALVWSVASVAYGAVLTLPLFVLASWLTTRLLGPPAPPDTPTTSLVDSELPGEAALLEENAELGGGAVDVDREPR